MLADAPNINHLWARLLIEELVRGGCTCFALAPGSRSTPLALAVAENTRARAHVHFDERGAGFFALGHARAKGRPAAVITTSGSAVANLWPAVVEAEASMVPLIVLTADRPPELLQTGANQAIDQERIFGHYTRWAFTLPCPTLDAPPQFVLTTAAHALVRAQGVSAGPVHLNCQFREPLAPVPDGRDLQAYTAPLEPWAKARTPYTALRRVQGRDDLYSDSKALRILEKSARVLVIVGEPREKLDTSYVNMLAGVHDWPVFPDISSGLRTGPLYYAVPMFDQLLLSKEACFGPDCVLHLGGRFTSKRLHQFLERFRGRIPYIQVANHFSRLDPEHMVSLRLQSSVNRFVQAATLDGEIRETSPQIEKLREMSDAVEQHVDAWLSAQTSVTEIGIARAVSRLRPAESVLFLGNSMPVRDMDMYAASDGPAGPIFANRGASGIDGNVATAAGIGKARKVPVTAILGDLAVLHDLNSLALLRAAEAPFVLVVINNDGGGIFSFLPVAESTENFERFFGTPHGCTFAAAAGMFGLHYAAPRTLDEFRGEYAEAMTSARATIIEVSTNREDNVRQHRDLQAEIKQLLEKR